MKMSGPRLHTMNPTGRFSDRASDYVKYRPTYPAAAIDAVLEGLGPAGTLVAADVGAGTGISSRLLAERGVRVIAVEPNRVMRDAAEPHPLVEYRDGTAEATGLADASIGLVVCAQAFHWFEPAAALAEFRRILCPAGRLALVWNERDDADALTAEYGRLVREASENHPAEQRTEAAAALKTTRLFQGLRCTTFRHQQRLDLSGLVGRALSSSYVPKSGPRRDALLAALTDAHTLFADGKGEVVMVYETLVYLATAVA